MNKISRSLKLRVKTSENRELQVRDCDALLATEYNIETGEYIGKQKVAGVRSKYNPGRWEEIQLEETESHNLNFWIS